jgi:hypothetical protein
VSIMGGADVVRGRKLTKEERRRERELRKAGRREPDPLEGGVSTRPVGPRRGERRPADLGRSSRVVPAGDLCAGPTDLVG